MPLAFPNVGLTNVNLRLVRTVGMSESPFSYQQQAHDFGGARWKQRSLCHLEPFRGTISRGIFSGLKRALRHVYVWTSITYA